VPLPPQDGQKKFIETETASQMLGVALPDGPLTARFQAFLAEQTEYKVVSADQWLGIYRFSQEARPDPDADPASPPLPSPQATAWMACQNGDPVSVMVMSTVRSGTADSLRTALQTLQRLRVCWLHQTPVAQPAFGALTSLQPSAVPAEYLRCLQVKPDLSNFDEGQAWPVLLDNFVDWARGRSAAETADQ